jgi:hypothetical protein
VGARGPQGFRELSATASWDCDVNLLLRGAAGEQASGDGLPEVVFAWVGRERGRL